MPLLFKDRDESEPASEAGTPLDVGGMALVAGAFVIVAGWVDILVGWYPLGFGRPEWEFGAVSATVDGLPLSTLGVVVALLGASASGKRWGLWLVTGWTAWVLFVLMICAVLYGLTVPVALGALGPAGVESQLARAVVKTSSLLVIYVSFYGWMGYKAIQGLGRT